MPLAVTLQTIFFKSIELSSYPSLNILRLKLPHSTRLTGISHMKRSCHITGQASINALAQYNRLIPNLHSYML